ncbi:uncharacterized protein K452DRAFT_326332 [Aplosporella prunicola CBS 121167]|uniref:DUF1783-domain-containing protein n=1 Tax=Aplosporella prunicola CBS 121167 TaxID=1176127 RepID=A0A6A6BGL3_9PEZI|nr:uncharacterized protein K452DRAFT_326332 [Aplosporella prunicola CBS 121167]KAF2142414.1 hypothetical protein K452DRAFT_326332 [Aplosporella prunicola CBS 121167]
MQARPSLFQRLRPHLQPARPATLRRTLVAAPKPGSGPLMERRADRALPSVSTHRRWVYTVPLFFGIIGVSALAIFNYQKQSSSVTESTLYALRTNPAAREALGGEIYFASKIPWIRGEINQLHGRIDINFRVKGKKQCGTMRFRSERKTRMGYFETLEWSLKTDDGQVLQLLDSAKPDPFRRSSDDE